ncbi:MAG: electron transfer flavoprotein subunit beta/FixA family protein [Thermodesulfobacteriota bacterium]
MKLLVCVKPVVDLETMPGPHYLRSGSSGNGTTRYRINNFDEFALEEGLRIKEACPGTTLDVITVAPQNAGSVLTRALGMGADHAIHVLLELEGYVSPSVVAHLITQRAKEAGYNLILAGVMAEDDMHAQVGPMIAELLSVPVATAVVHQAVLDEGRAVYVEREIEGGEREALELVLPAVLTVQTGINRPRYPSLSKYLRAKKQQPETIHAAAQRAIDPPETLLRVTEPQKLRTGLILEGTPEEKATRLLGILREKALIPEERHAEP